MSADRLAELHRQRALLQEHLAWLDREIVEASPPTKPSGSGVALPTPAITSAAPERSAREVAIPAPPPSGSGLAPDTILDEFRVAPDTLRTDVRKGCILYFVGAFAVLALCIMVMYYALSRR